MLSWRRSFNRATSRSVVTGTPSSLSSSRTFFSATVGHSPSRCLDVSSSACVDATRRVDAEVTRQLQSKVGDTVLAEGYKCEGSKSMARGTSGGDGGVWRAARGSGLAASVTTCRSGREARHDGAVEPYTLSHKFLRSTRCKGGGFKARVEAIGHRQARQPGAGTEGGGRPSGRWAGGVVVPPETVPRPIHSAGGPSPIFSIFLKRPRRLGSRLSRRPDEEDEAGADAPDGAASPSSHASEPIGQGAPAHPTGTSQVPTDARRAAEAGRDSGGPGGRWALQRRTWGLNLQADSNPTDRPPLRPPRHGPRHHARYAGEASSDRV